MSDYKIPVRAEYSGNDTVGLSEYQNVDGTNNEVISRRFGGTGLDDFKGTIGDFLVIKNDDDVYDTFTLGNDQFLIGNGAGSGPTSASAATVRTLLGVVVGTDSQAQSSVLSSLAGLTIADSTFIVGNGNGTFAAESGATARTSLGVDVAGTDNSVNVSLAGKDYITAAGTNSQT